MQYSTLIAQIEADIYSNGAELITGDILQTVLKRMVSAWASAGAAYGGTISPDTVVPLSLDQATVYLALTAGTYENFLDGEGDPIETTGPALVIYDGGPALIFSKTDLPSGGSGATVITNDGSACDSVAIRLTDSQTYKRVFRIDVAGTYTGGDVILRIGSLIIECFDVDNNICHGYYYGDDMSEILTEVAVYQDGISPDTFYLMLTHESILDSVNFAITPLDGGEVDAFTTNAADDHTKVDDANITEIEKTSNKVSTISGNETNTTKYPNTKAVADALGKIGVISQTQTWRGSGSNPRTYVMSNQVTGLIPQANIDLFESAGATFNESTGYFELNGLTDISYEEMQDIYYKSIGMVPIAISRSTQGVGYSARATLPMLATLSYQTNISYWFYNATVEHINIENSGLVYVNVAGSGTTAFQGCLYLRSINGRMKLSATSSYSNIFTGCVSLETVNITSLSSNISFANSPNLTAASVAYMISNAGTATITITLHATAYARAIADASVQAALAAKTNVSLASA